MALERIDEIPEYFRIPKTDSVFIDWREEVANGAPHPIQMHMEEYIRLRIGTTHIDTIRNQSNFYGNMSGVDDQLLKDYLRRPEISWAVDISFDGLYIKKDVNRAVLQTTFTFFVFIKREQATFWGLKYSA